MPYSMYDTKSPLANGLITFISHGPLDFGPSCHNSYRVSQQDLHNSAGYDWVERHGNLEGRFRFFETYNASSHIYLRIIKPLLSIHATGSIDVERVAKPFKRNLL